MFATGTATKIKASFYNTSGDPITAGMMTIKLHTISLADQLAGTALTYADDASVLTLTAAAAAARADNLSYALVDEGLAMTVTTSGDWAGAFSGSVIVAWVYVENES